jgi:two-component system, OmpR family, response regulator
MARILLVEDDPDVGPLLEHILLEHRYQVTTAETVLTATALLNSQPFDLVICDVNLPDGSGLTVADRAKAAGVKALVMTGQGLSVELGNLQPYDYLLKPLRVAELLASVERRLFGKSGDESEVIQFPKPGV